MTIVQSICRNWKLYLAVLVVTLAATIAFNTFSKKVYLGSAVFEIIDTDPILEGAARSDNPSVISADVASALNEVFSVETLKKSFPEPSLRNLEFKPIRRSNSHFGAEITGTNPEKIREALEKLPQLLNESTDLKQKAEAVLQLIAAEKSALDPALALSQKTKAHIESLITQNRIQQISFDPVEALQNVAKLEARAALLNQAQARVQNGILISFAKPQVNSKAIQPRKAMNLVFWPILALFLTMFALSTCASACEAKGKDT